MITTVAAAGDIFMTRRLPDVPYPGEAALAEFLRNFDVRFANLEITVHDREGSPGAVSGGTWAMAHPGILKDLRRIPFNVWNAANNHALDYSHDGLLATLRHLEDADMRYAGIGRNLADASAPVYIETPAARVAMIAAVSTCPDFWMAGQQRIDMRGRPGVNKLRYVTDYHVTPVQLAALKEMAGPLYINAAHDSSVREGFEAPDEGFYRFGTMRFIEDSVTETRTSPNAADLARITASVREAKRQADLVLVSIHAHETYKGDKEQPAEFLRTFAHACVDAGASAILGHGPHILRGIELYNGAPIFYSLGNFLFENDTTTHQPADFYGKYRLDPLTATSGMGMDARSHDDTIGLSRDPRVWESVVPCMTFENTRLVSLTLQPVEMGFELPRYRKGLPVLSRDMSVIERLAKLSSPFGTKISADGETGRAVLP